MMDENLSEPSWDFVSAGEAKWQLHKGHAEVTSATLYERLIQSQRRVWHLHVFREESVALWSTSSSFGITSSSGKEVLLAQGARVTSASLYVEDDHLIACVVQNLNSIEVYTVNAISFDTQGKLSMISSGSVSHLLKIPQSGYFLCSNSTATDSDSFSLLEANFDSQPSLSVIAEISSTLEVASSIVNLAALASYPSAVAAAFYNAKKEQTERLDAVVFDIAQILAHSPKERGVVRVSITPICCTLRRAPAAQSSSALSLFRSSTAEKPLQLAACVLQAAHVFPVLSHSTNTAGDIILSTDHVHFLCHALSYPVDAEKEPTRYVIEHTTAYDQLAHKMSAELGPTVFSRLLTDDFLHAATTNSHLTGSVLHSQLEACIHMQSFGAFSGIALSAATQELQVGRTLGEPLSLWELCSVLQAYLPSRAHSFLSQSPPQWTLKRRQQQLLEASLVTNTVDLVVQAIHDQATDLLIRGGGFAAPFTLSNIQDVFAWVLGEESEGTLSGCTSLQTGLSRDLAQLMHEQLVPFLLSSSSLSAAQRVHVQSSIRETSIVSQALRQLSEALYQRKLHSLHEEQLLHGHQRQQRLAGGVDSSDATNVVYAGDLASHSTAALQLSVATSKWQAQFVAVCALLRTQTVAAFDKCDLTALAQGVISTRLQNVASVVESHNVLLPSQDLQLVHAPLLIDCLRALMSVHGPVATVEENVSAETSQLQLAFQQVLQSTDVLQLLSDSSQPDANRIAVVADVLLAPWHLLDTYRRYLLATQAYDGLRLDAFVGLLQREVVACTRFVLYLVVQVYLFSYRSAGSTSTSEHADVYNLPFFSQLQQAFEVEIEEVQLAITLVLLDIDHTSRTTGNNTHWQHAVSFLCHHSNREVLQRLYCTQLPAGLLHQESSGSLRSSSIDSNSSGKEDDKSLAFACVQRLLVRGHATAARKLLQALATLAPMLVNVNGRASEQNLSRDRAFASLPGVVAWICAIDDPADEQEQNPADNVTGSMDVDENDNSDEEEDNEVSAQKKVAQWVVVWQETRAKIALIPSPSLALRATQATMRCLCAWTVRHGCFHRLLQRSDLDLAEVEAVSVFLADLAEAEIASALCPAPAVDALIGYLLQHRRGDQAQVWHYRHAAAVEAVLPDHDVDEDERRSSLRDRFALLQAHSLKVSVVPAVDADVPANLQRSRRILGQLC